MLIVVRLYYNTVNIMLRNFLKFSLSLGGLNVCVKVFPLWHFVGGFGGFVGVVRIVFSRVVLLLLFVYVCLLCLTYIPT